MKERVNEHTSLELSKRLWDNGFRGEHRAIYLNGMLYPKERICTCDGCNTRAEDNDSIIPAYTFAEIWRVLPQMLFNRACLKMLKVNDKVHTTIGYIKIGSNNYIENYFHESPAEAAGLLLEWLIDEGHYDTGGKQDA